MKKLTVVLMLMGMATLFNSVAQAGFVNPEEDSNAAPFLCEFAGSQNQYEWEFDYDAIEPTLTMEEIIYAVVPDQVIISGETDEDPTFTVVKTITNTSCVDWTGYILTLTSDSGTTFVEGSAGAGGGKLQTVEYLDSQTIVFSGAEPVLNGELLSLQFDINVPTCGLFDFTLTQAPVPEPAAITLLGLGSLALFRRRRALG